MARPPKHPGLQDKFESALREILAAGESLPSKEIVDGLRQRAASLAIDAGELDAVTRNFSNYIGRAKDRGLVASNGPHAGYRLAEHEALADGDGLEPAQATGREPVPTEARASQRIHRESLLHLPLTVALSAHFKARAKSLPTFTDNVRWANPDMLMLRWSPLSALETLDGELDIDRFRLVDVTPECILSSLEVKVFTRDRTQLFTAISETAANSRWANEAWLVFHDREGSTAPLDDDVLSLARTAEVGVLELCIRDDDGTLALRAHHAAPVRPTLRVSELSSDRRGVLRAAQALLTEWGNGDGAYVDVESDERKALVLLQQAIANLRSQKGFSASTGLDAMLRPFLADARAASLARAMMRATLQTAGASAELAGGASLVATLTAAAERFSAKLEAEAFVRDLHVLAGA